MSVPQRLENEEPIAYLERLIVLGGEASFNQLLIERQKLVVKWLKEEGDLPNLKEEVESMAEDRVAKALTHVGAPQEYVTLLQFVIDVAVGLKTVPALIEYVKQTVLDENLDLESQVQGIRGL